MIVLFLFTHENDGRSDRLFGRITIVRKDPAAPAMFHGQRMRHNDFNDPRTAWRYFRALALRHGTDVGPYSGVASPVVIGKAFKLGDFRYDA